MISEKHNNIPSDEPYLRLAIDLARQARQRGNEPFGAVLVVADTVVHQSLGGSLEFSDPTFHAELRLISEYCRANRRLVLRGGTDMLEQLDFVHFPRT